MTEVTRKTRTKTDIRYSSRGLYTDRKLREEIQYSSLTQFNNHRVSSVTEQSHIQDYVGLQTVCPLTCIRGAQLIKQNPLPINRNKSPALRLVSLPVGLWLRGGQHRGRPMVGTRRCRCPSAWRTLRLPGSLSHGGSSALRPPPSDAPRPSCSDRWPSARFAW